MRATYWAFTATAAAARLDFPFRCTQRTLARASVVLTCLSSRLASHGTCNRSCKVAVLARVAAIKLGLETGGTVEKEKPRIHHDMAQSDKLRVPRHHMNKRALPRALQFVTGVLTQRMQFNRANSMAEFSPSHSHSPMLE
jgi:hypothetical protein